MYGKLDAITNQDPFFQDICKPSSCLNHLIPPPRDTSVITRLRPTTLLSNPSLRTKKYCSFINFGLHFTFTNQKSNSQPLHSAHPFHCTYVMYVVCFDLYCFMYYFTCISFAIRPSGRKSAIKLIEEVHL